MRILGTLLVVTTLITPALAQSPAPSAALSAQRDRMKTCNVDAGSQKLTGDARKSFMADCLAGKSASTPEKQLTPQQTKMKTCNADASAKGLKGAARKSFMSTCLKG